MSRIGARDTVPEVVVRSTLHKMGIRFRLHRRDLPGKPDIVLPKHRTVVFVHGCFWHRHSCKKGRSFPRSNTVFWAEKLERNRERDGENRRALEAEGWRVVVVWECQTKDRQRLTELLMRKFGMVADTGSLSRSAGPEG